MLKLISIHPLLKSQRYLTIPLVVILGMASLEPAQAAALRYKDSTTAFKTVFDNDTPVIIPGVGIDGDQDFDLGDIKVDLLGLAEFGGNVAIGNTKPQVGSAAKPQLSLQVNADSGPAGGNLTVQFSDTDFTLEGLNNWMAGLSGTLFSGTGAQYSARIYLDNSNALFSTGPETFLMELGPLDGVMAKSQDRAAQFVTQNPFSATVELIVAHEGDTTSRTDVNVETKIPEPATGIGLGVGAIAVALNRWRRLRLS